MRGQDSTTVHRSQGSSPELGKSQDDTTILGKIKPVEDTVQRGLSGDVCCLLAMQFLESKDIKLSFENIVVATYRLFPSKFGLANYPEFPDSNAVFNSVNLHMQFSKGTSRHWVRGNRRQGYGITEQGRRVLQKYDWVLSRTTKEKAAPRLTQREEKILELIRQSEPYRKFKEGSEDITDEDVAFMLRFPVGEDPRLASQALAKALSASEKANDRLVTKLLHHISGRHKRLFEYRGGSWTRSAD